MTKNKDTSISQKGGVLSKQAIYQRLSKLTPRAIEILSELLDSRNENIRLGAINKILDKCIPDLKAMQLDGKNGEPVKILLVSYGNNDPLSIYAHAVHGAGSVGSSSVPSIELAPESSKDNSSHQPTNSLG